MSERDDGDADDRDPAATGGRGRDEPVELGDRRRKHVSVTTAEGERVEHGDVFVRHSGDGFAVASELGFPDAETTRYEKAALRRVEVTQHHAACFITTATAGEGPTLDALRGFRDDAMARTPVGRALLVLYDAASPPVARTLARHPDGRTARAVRWLVEHCADLARRRAAARSRSARLSASAALALAYAAGLAFALAGHAAIVARERLVGRSGSALLGGGQEQPGQPGEHREDAEQE